MPLEAVAFDIGGVLAKIDKRPLLDLLTKHKQRERDFFDADFISLQCGTISHDDFFYIKSQKTSIKSSKLLSAFKAMINISSSMEFFSRLNMPYFYLSNINQIHYEIFLDSMPSSPCAREHSILSYQVGCLKPEARFFYHINDFELHNILYIDDKINNLCAAKSLGIKTLLCVDQESLPSTLFTVLI